MSNVRITVVLGDLLGCGYYRCVLPYKKLAEHGFDVSLVNVIDGPELAKTSDFVLLQRQNNPQMPQLVQALQAHGIKVGYELDDLLHNIPAKNPCRAGYLPGSPTFVGSLEIIKAVNVMTVSTSALRDSYLDKQPNIHVCPNSIDDEIASKATFEPLTWKPGEEFRLGWAGSGTHQEDLESVMRVLLGIMTEYPYVKLCLIGQDYRPLFPMQLWPRITHLGHTFPITKNGQIALADPNYNPVVKYYELLKSANLHLAIAPITSHPFNRSKSYIKLIEYGLASVPAIASSFGPYRRYASQYSWPNRMNAPVLLADTNSDWRRSIREMIANEDLRLSVAKNNFDKIQTQHTVNNNSDNWIQALASVGLYPGTMPGSYTERLVQNK